LFRLWQNDEKGLRLRYSYYGSSCILHEPEFGGDSQIKDDHLRTNMGKVVSFTKNGCTLIHEQRGVKNLLYVVRK